MDDDTEHQEILLAVKANSDSISSLNRKLDKAITRIETENQPSREFFDDMATAGRIGRTVRSVVGWVVLISGIFAFIWVSVSYAIKGF
jgi:hypothetical protein